MALIEGASGVFARLNYSFDDPNSHVQEFSDETKSHLDTVPPVIEKWQAQDIANNTVGGYFKNPVETQVNTVITLSTQFKNVSNAVSNLSLMYVAANNLYNNATAFLAHTNRISGVTPFSGEDETIPWYNTALNYGKSAVYITNQTDGIVNSAPIMGSFTSILVGPQISANANVMTSDYVTVNSSIYTDGMGNVYSNLTTTQINTIITHITSTQNLLTTRQTSDYTYYNNLRTFLSSYNELKQFSNMGDTQNNLVQNLIGSDKLLSRINS